MEFWIVGQLVVDIVLLFLFVYLVRTINHRSSGNISDKTVGRLREVMEPVLRDAEKVAKKFESQLKTKQQTIRKLNEYLDDRTISLNLLLNRAELYLEESQEKDKKTAPKLHVVDQQKEIIALAQKGLDSEKIAKQLSISVGEVELVLDLKKKFLKMETEGFLS
jgi:hypothetical protein